MCTSMAQKGAAYMKIGVTERGDAGIDFSWHAKLSSIDGAVIITKRMGPEFNRLMLTASKPCILHCTCTGRGGTWLEPNVPDFATQLTWLKELVHAGFPAERCVVRIDPIIPDRDGITAAGNVLTMLQETLPEVKRIRFSVYDEYRHVKERLIAAGHEPFYRNDRFYAPDFMKENVIRELCRHPYVYETCAEDWAARNDTLSRFITRGCVSATDLALMNLSLPDGLSENSQGRKGCHCLSCKTELLTQKRQCTNKCIYCYWKQD